MHVISSKYVVFLLVLAKPSLNSKAVGAIVQGRSLSLKF